MRFAMVTLAAALLLFGASSAGAQATPPVTPSTPTTKPAVPAEDPVQLRLKLLARDAKDQSDKRRLAAWEELLTFGEPGTKVLKPIVEAKLQRDRKALEEHFKSTELARARKKVEEALIERRKVALDCIYDHHRYPDENHGAVGQPEVNRLVDLVRKVWDHPAQFVREATPEIETLAALLEEDVVYLGCSGGVAPADLANVNDWLDSLTPTFERERLGINGSQQDWNATLAKYHAEELLTSADDQELACMNATNDYRLMMGRAMVEIDERLVRAGRKHSQEMFELDYFEHSSPVKENATFGGRCAHEGYHGASAENIAYGGDGLDAFWGWYSSSGHHRNMLAGHRQIGIGRAGNYPGHLFTEDFGSGDSLRGRTIDDPQILYLAKLKKLEVTSADAEAALAAWCKANKLDEPFKKHVEAALALDPDHDKAHELLGHVKVNGRWTDGAGTGAAAGSGGSRKTPAEHDRR